MLIFQNETNLLDFYLSILSVIMEAKLMHYDLVYLTVWYTYTRIGVYKINKTIKAFGNQIFFKEV